MTLSADDIEVARAGMSGALEPWLDFNAGHGLWDPEGRSLTAPFPPADLMQLTTAQGEEPVFVDHGMTMVRALAAASPTPLNGYRSILDFGCGVGRLARMFKGFGGEYVGVDVHEPSIAWIKSALPYVEAHLTQPRGVLPVTGRRFDCVISISVFTHMNEADQHFYLAELRRTTRRDGTLMLTTHGYRALKRALNEDSIHNMLAMPRDNLTAALDEFADGSGFYFYNQHDHLSSDHYEYGITFINSNYIRRVWGSYFKVIDIIPGGIHDFQDIVVLRAV